MYRTEIDGLRALAIIAVIINHIDSSLLPLGYLGVDIFFVISGLVITQSLCANKYSSLGDFILGFYNRRIKRLIPALYLFIVVTCMCIVFLVPPSGLARSSLHTGVAALFGISNLYLLYQAIDYFGSAAEINPFTHTWSLGVEEQFYLFFPFILWYSGLAQHTNTGSRNFLIIISIAGIVSLIAYFWIGDKYQSMAFYLVVCRFWELAIGSISYLIWQKSGPAINARERVAGYVTFCTTILLVSVLFIPNSSVPGLVTFVTVLLSAVILVLIRPYTFVYKILTVKVLVFLGVISYSLYLWHWSVLTISTWTLGQHGWLLPVQLAIIFCMAVISYVFVEKPLRRARWNIFGLDRFPRAQVIGLALVLASALASLVMYLIIPHHNRGHFFTGTTAPLVKKGVKSLQDRLDYNEFTWLASQCVLSSNKDVGKIISTEYCTFGDFTHGHRRFLVIGNSFSAAEIEMYMLLVENGYGSVTVTSSWGAAAVPEIDNKNQWAKANDYYWNSVVPSLINQLQSGDVVLMINDGASLSPRVFNNQSNKKLIDLRAGLERMASELLKRGIHVIYQSGIPFLRDSNCTPDMAMRQWWNTGNQPPCTYYSKKDSLERRRTYHELLLELQNKYTNFHVLDLFDIYCPGKVCKYYNDQGIFLFRDEFSHPSVEANILAQPVLLETVDKIINGTGRPKTRWRVE